MYLSRKDFIEEVTARIYLGYLMAINDKDFFTLVLSGGNTPGSVFDNLVSNYGSKIDWSKIHLFWLDERFVPDHHPESNFNLAEQRLISHISDIGSIVKYDKNVDAKTSAKLYLAKIQDFFCGKEAIFDLILMGMGTDGHVASIFPSELEFNNTRADVFSTEIAHNGFIRLSMNYNIINRCKCNLLMVNSAEKLKVLTLNESLPVHIVKNIVPIITIDN